MKTNFVKLLGVAGVVVAGIAAPAHAETAQGDATVKILSAITVTKAADLNFGNVVSSNAAATVSVGEDGTRTCGTGLNCYGTTTAGAFSVAGAAGETVSVGIDTPTIQLSNGTQSMAVALSTSTSALTLTGGVGSFNVAGTLSVGANQAAGTYTGQYNVSVNYQ